MRKKSLILDESETETELEEDAQDEEGAIKQTNSIAKMFKSMNFI